MKSSTSSMMGLLTTCLLAMSRTTTLTPSSKGGCSRRFLFTSAFNLPSTSITSSTSSYVRTTSHLNRRQIIGSFSPSRTRTRTTRSKSMFSANPTTTSYDDDRDSAMMDADATMVWTDYGDSGDSGYTRPGVQWYPGHIAKAERQLSETLKAVDVVVEVRDARAAKATSHPKVGEWCAGRPRIVVLTHLDMIPRSAASAWRRAYESLGAERWDEFTGSTTTANKEGYNVLSNPQVANQAKQARQVRFQYSTADAGSLSRTGRKKKTKVQKMDSSSRKALSSSPSGLVGSKSKSNSQNINNNNNNASITPVEEVLFVNAKQGEGIHALHRAIFKAGSHVQERRERRGLNPRALRVGIIGYPNVGKSALINKILGRRRARTANTPGVTRSLQWIRVRRSDETSASGSSSSSGGGGGGSSSRDNSIKKEFELLDSPGVIPAKLVDQSDAMLLAACNCIGQAAYDNQAVAAYLCEWMKGIHILEKQNIVAPQWRRKCKERYGFDPMQPLSSSSSDSNKDGGSVSVDNTTPPVMYMTGEDMLFKVADNTCRGDPEDASRKILQDFRTGRMGPISLQIAPESTVDEGQLMVPVGGVYGNQDSFDKKRQQQVHEEQRKIKLERARVALETAKERGLELPPIVTEASSTTTTTKTHEDEDSNNNGTIRSSSKVPNSDIGKGMFDGW